MEIQYSVVINSMGGGSVALVLRSWTLDEEGQQVTIKSEIKTGLTLDECFNLTKAFLKICSGVLLS
jgi:hypothetical protein